MAENNRLHIQHYYTTGNTVPSADNVKLGEIAVGAGKDNEKLIIKNNENGIVKFLPEGADTSYAESGHTHTDYLDKNSTESQTVEGPIKFSNGIEVYDDNAGEKLVANFKLVGDTPIINVGEGGDYVLHTGNVTTGEGLEVDTMGGYTLSISEDYQEKINKGVEASTKIDAFLKDANMTGDVIDTLVELQGYISSDSGVTQTLLNNVANLQSGLTQAEKDIDNLEDKQVTEATVTGWGFTKNTGTYSKPSGGIPKDDLDSDVQNSLVKADTALQSYTEQYKGTITGITIKALNGLKIVDNNGVISGATGSTSGTIQIKGETANNHGGLGVSTLYNGDLNGMEYQDGAAAAAAHTHSQYLTGYTEQYKGTITGVTAGSGLTGGGSASSGASSVTLDVACGEGLEIDESGYVTLSKIVDREDINEENGTFCVSDGDDKNAIVSMIGFDEYGRNSGYTLRRITTISCGTF